MAGKLILADTSILIDYFRKKDKSNSILLSLFDQGYDFCISAITYYEIYTGANAIQLSIWEQILLNIPVIPFDTIVAETAVDINADLRSKRKQIQMADLFIAATAIANDFPIATLNKKHFERVDKLEII